jgi:hypothetical protein
MGRAKARLSKGQPKGARSASGRKRDRSIPRLGPCEGIERRRRECGVADNDTDTIDAIGRAYVAGLLGTGEHAKDLLIAGRRLAAQYWRVYGFPTPDSLARFQPQQPSGPMDPVAERIREQVLTQALASVTAKGHHVRRAFDALVIDLQFDCGPAFLDAIIYAHRRERQATEREYDQLRWALEGLEEIA